jgi:hypothetical protein
MATINILLLSFMNSITKENTFVGFCLTHVVLNMVEIIGGCVA